nr:response regulator [Paenibacillus oceani]
MLQEEIDDLAVILMDVQMPGLNGFEMVKRIKQRDRCKDIPVIFLNAISFSHEHDRRGYDVGSIDYLFKPVDPELLKMKVEAFVKLHRCHRSRSTMINVCWKSSSTSPSSSGSRRK